MADKTFHDMIAAVHFEGIVGTDGTVEPNGDLFVFGDPGVSSLHDYRLIPVLNGLQSIAPLNSSLNLFSGEYEMSAVDIILQAREDIAKTFIPVDREPSAFLFEAVNEFSNFRVDSGSCAVGDIIYIGDETAEVTSITPLGAIDILTVSRGLGLSTARAYPAGELIYKQAPYLRSRTVRLFTLEDLGQPQQRWVGFYDAKRAINCHTGIRIQTSEQLAVLGDKEGNTVNRRLYHNRNAVRISRNGTGLSGRIEIPPDYVGMTNLSRVFLHVKHDSIGDRIVEANFIPDRDSRNFILGRVSFDVVNNRINISSESRWLYNTARVEDPPQYLPEDAEIREILYYNRLTPDVTNMNFFAGNTPEGIVLAFLTSTGRNDNNAKDPTSAGFLNTDHFADDLGLGIPYESINVQSFLDCINEDPVEIDQFIVGLNGDTVPIRALGIDMLRSMNRFLAQDRDGNLACRRLRSLSIRDLGRLEAADHNAIVLPDDLPLDFSEDRSVFKLKARVGEIEGFSDGIEVQTATRARNRAETLMASGSADFYDYQWIFQNRWRHVLQDLESKAKLRRETPPIATARVPMSHCEEVTNFITEGETPGLGEFVRLFRSPESTIRFMGPDGCYLDLNEDAAFLPYTGIIVSFEPDFECWEIELKVALVGWRQKNIVRVVAPSGVIVEVSGNVVTLQSDELLSFDGDHGFEVGDDVTFFTEDGRRWCGAGDTFEVTAIVGDDIFLDSAPGAMASLPTDICFLEIVCAPEFSNPIFDGVSILPASFAQRRYAFLSDDNDQVDGFIGDVYGVT